MKERAHLSPDFERAQATEADQLGITSLPNGPESQTGRREHLQMGFQHLCCLFPRDHLVILQIPAHIRSVQSVYRAP